MSSHSPKDGRIFNKHGGKGCWDLAGNYVCCLFCCFWGANLLEEFWFSPSPSKHLDLRTVVFCEFSWLNHWQPTPSLFWWRRPLVIRKRFQEPQQLMDTFTDLEELNLFLIQSSQADADEATSCEGWWWCCIHKFGMGRTCGGRSNNAKDWEV